MTRMVSKFITGCLKTKQTHYYSWFTCIINIFSNFILDSPSLLQSPINGDLTGKEKPFIKKTLAQNRKDSAENSPTAGKINGLKVWYNSKQCENS